MFLIKDTIEYGFWKIQLSRTHTTLRNDSIDFIISIKKYFKYLPLINCEFLWLFSTNEILIWLLCPLFPHWSVATGNLRPVRLIVWWIVLNPESSLPKDRSTKAVTFYSIFLQVERIFFFFRNTKNKWFLWVISFKFAEVIRLPRNWCKASDYLVFGIFW